MTLYVESNFVLELALDQAQHRQCVALLDACLGAGVRLAVPAFSVAEPYTTLARRHAARLDLRQTLDREFRQLGRSGPCADSVDIMHAATALLARSIDEESRRLAVTAERVLAVADVVPLTAENLSDGLAYAARLGLDLPDGIVLASVLLDLDSHAPRWGCFVSRDEDFDIDEVQALLEARQCKLLFDFEDGLNYVRSRIGTPPAASG